MVSNYFSPQSFVGLNQLSGWGIAGILTGSVDLGLDEIWANDAHGHNREDKIRIFSYSLNEDLESYLEAEMLPAANLMVFLKCFAGCTADFSCLIS